MDHRTFLAHAVKLELEAEMAYRDLVELMKERGNADASAFFLEMAECSRLHRKVAMARAGFDETTDIAAIRAAGQPFHVETPELTKDENELELDEAMALVLVAERRGEWFYAQVAQTTKDIETSKLAREFVAEEQGHVLALERFMGLKPY